MTILSGFLTHKYSRLVLVFLVAFYTFSLWHRIPDIDDAWIGELAYWLSEEGQMRSELMRGITLQEEKFVVNNKLFALSGALVIKVFGFSLYTLKSVSLVWFIIFLLLFYAYTMKWRRLFSRNDLFFSMLIIFSFTYLFKFSFLFRPEVMMMALGFAGYILLEKFLDEKKTAYLLVSGILFGLTSATHLNGLILVASAGILLALNRQFVAILVFGIGILIGFVPFFFDMTNRADFDLWYHQFFESPALDSIAAGPVWMKPFFNLVREYIRYFYKIEIAVYSVFLITSFAVGYRFLMKHHRNLMLFALLNILLTGIIAMHKSQQYLLLNFPYVLILIVLTHKALSEGKIKQFRLGSLQVNSRVLSLLLATFLFVSLYHNALLAFQKFSPLQNRELAKEYAGELSDEMNIVAPMTFIFNEIVHFKRIQGEVCYIELQKTDPSIFGSGFLEKAKSFEIDMLLLTPMYAEALGVSEFDQGDSVMGYQVMNKTEFLIVIKRIQE